MSLDPLFAPHEEPIKHRKRAEEGQPALIENSRRPSPIALVNHLRGNVKSWREGDYQGASETSRELLHYWFDREHGTMRPNGMFELFRYYFCQREAVETMIYLYEVEGIRTVKALLQSSGESTDHIVASGLHPDENLWARYAFKLATGAGKTKVMSLAIVWSYFHALRETGSPLARHFVVIAPNLTVFERLREDFKPVQGGPDIFDRDPLIPPAWRAVWNLTTVLQDEPGGAPTGGTLYLTNIHRLHDRGDGSDGEDQDDEAPKKIAKKAPKKLTKKQLAETHSWFGPAINKASALDTAAALRARVTDHGRVMVLNDEAHHLWDPDSAWNEAIAFLHKEIRANSGEGVVAQLDFSATPKDNNGSLFKHIVCDTPLGEAVDGGIVKTPVIGRGAEWVERSDSDASLRYEEQLRLGYARWLASQEEWKLSGKKPLLFIMCEDTTAADQIADRMNRDPLYAELNGRTINLHTNLKGKIKWVGGRKNGYPVFEAKEADITEDDLKALRELSRQLDSDQNPYTCIVSVLMLREGWDVRNVTTIVPLRPYTSKANILPEQTLGRGLRRMTPPGTANELVTVVEHPAFVSLYEKELEQQGLIIETMDADKVPKATVTIFPDEESKDVAALDIFIPSVSAGFGRKTALGGFGIEDVQGRMDSLNLTLLPVGEIRSEDIHYEERHLITNELIRVLEIRIPLLCSGIGAVSFFREELERACSLRGTHATLAPLLEVFLTEMLFEEKLTLFDPRLVGRLGDSDVRKRVQAVFVPLILEWTTKSELRQNQDQSRSLAAWKPFQVTHSREHPVVSAKKSLFNLVPCDRGFEVAMSRFLDGASDVAAFAKNAGPQALRFDYVTVKGQLAFYTPDFLVKLTDKRFLLIETKGREDRDVPHKARAAVAWCEAATRESATWEYVYVQEDEFEGIQGNTAEMLRRSCESALSDLLQALR